METKLTISQLKNYLDTELECLLDYGDESYFDKLVGIHIDGDLMFENDQGDTHTIDSVKPLMFKLSDLDKFVPELGFAPLEQVDFHHNFSVLQTGQLMTDPTRYPFTVVQALIEWHFWIFGDEYFTDGLIIDKLK